MKILTIQTKPTPESDEQDVTINLAKINFVVRAPLEPWIIHLAGAVFQVNDFDTTKMVDSGLVEFESTEGTTAYINKDRVTGFTSPELGVYLIVFDGGRVGVKATLAEVESKLGIGD